MQGHQQQQGRKPITINSMDVRKCTVEQNKTKVERGKTVESSKAGRNNKVPVPSSARSLATAGTPAQERTPATKETLATKGT